MTNVKILQFKVHTFEPFKSYIYLLISRNILLNHMFRIKRLCSSYLINKSISELIYDPLHDGFP